MHFSVFSFPSTAARIAVLVLPLLLLWSCVAADVAASQIDGRSIAASVSDDENSSAATVPDGTVIQKLPEAPGAAADDATSEVSYGVTDSPAGTDQPESETSAAAAVNDDDSAEFDFTSDDGTAETAETGSRWIQKVPRRRPSAKSAKSLNDASEGEASASTPPAGNPLSLGQVLANVLYGPAWSATDTSAECSEDMRIYNLHMKNFTLWAAKMLDATSKGPEGLLDGNTFSFGNFDQCLSTKSKNLGISGGYSLVDIDYRPTYQLHPGFYNDNHTDDLEFFFDMDQSAWEAINHNIQEDYIQRHKFQWAVCLPANCHYNDVQQIMRNVLVPELNRHGFEANVTIDPLLHTSSQNTYKYTAGFYLVCAMFLILSLLVASGTLYDLIFLYYRPKFEHGPMKKIMKPFSLISNIERLLKPSETEEFSIINGMKVCCILQVISGHRWFIEFGNPQANTDFIYRLIHNEWMGYFKCAIFLETFFVISGFLTFHLITKQLMEKKRLNFIPIMIYRWLRIFPVYGSLIVTYIFVLPYLNDGPYWRKLIYRESERCQTNWWTNVLFINNYVNTDELCIIPSWYLACDFHFFIIGTLLTYAIWKWRRQGLIILGALLTLSTVVPTYIIINQKHRGVTSINPSDLNDLSKDRFFTEVYIKSHMRSLTYFIGILAGYLYMRMKEADYTFSLKSRIICFPAALAIGNTIYLVCGMFYILGHEYNAYEHALYFTLGRLVWGILVAYAIIGHGISGFGVCMSGFLGHRLFHVVGKLVFCIYIYQELIQLQTIGSIRTPMYQNLTLMAWKWSGDLLMALMYAFAINVMIESPFDRLQKNVMKLILGNQFSKPRPQPLTDDSENKSENLTA